MSNNDYNISRKIELNVTKKLFKYINTNVDLAPVIEEFYDDYAYFNETDNNIVFSIWLSLNYKDENGDTFTQKFLEDNSAFLSEYERKVLRQREESYVSLFKIEGFHGRNVHVKDILCKKEFKILEPNLSSILNEGDYVFSRIGKTLNNYSFIGDINFFPPEYKYDFIEAILLDFNTLREDLENLTIRSYLKRFGLNLYKIYDRITYKLSNSDDDFELHNLNGTKAIKAFKSHLSTQMPNEEVEKHLTNLNNIISFYIYNNKEIDPSFRDIDIHEFLDSAIDIKFINTRSELLSYIESIHSYLLFLYEKNDDYKDLYYEIKDIKNSPFNYLRALNSSVTSFVFNRSFSFFIEEGLSHKSLSIVEDLDLFLYYIKNNLIELTETLKNMKRKDLKNINNQLKNSVSPVSKAPNQKDFAVIDFFFKFSLDLDLVGISDRYMFPNDSLYDYLALGSSEKYAILIDYILDEVFEEDIYGKEGLLKKLSNMKPSKKYSNSYLFDSTSEVSDPLYLLKLLDIISYESDGDYTRITSFGRKVSNYLSKYKSLESDRLVNLKNFKN